jgi:hypothetical protein
LNVWIIQKKIKNYGQKCKHYEALLTKICGYKNSQNGALVIIKQIFSSLIWKYNLMIT